MHILLLSFGAKNAESLIGQSLEFSVVVQVAKNVEMKKPEYRKPFQKVFSWNVFIKGIQTLR